MRQEQILLACVTVVLLFGFLASSLHQPPLSGFVVQQDILVEDLDCRWNGKSFDACMSVDWSHVPGTSAKAYFSGGTPLNDLIPFQTTSFTFCDPVGSREAVRGGGVYIYDQEGRTVDLRKDVSVHCRHTPTSDTTFTDHATFVTGANDHAAPRGSGTLLFELPAAPTSCTFSGTWRTNNRLEASTTSFSTKAPDFCHDYTGTFVGSATAFQQASTSDPSAFSLAGSSVPPFDLAPSSRDGFVFRIPLCDRDWSYYGGERYFTQAYVSTFDQNLVLTWTYVSDDPQPVVEVSLDIACDLQEGPQLPRKHRVSLEQPRSQPPQDYESFQLDQASLSPALPEPAPQPFFTRLHTILRSFFGGLS